MATLASQALNRAGLTPSFAAATGGGDAFTPDSNTFLRIKNASGSAITATIVTPKVNRYGNAIADNAVVIPATTGDVLIGPFPAEEYADPANSGLTTITYSGVTSLTVAAVQLQQP